MYLLFCNCQDGAHYVLCPKQGHKIEVVIVNKVCIRVVTWYMGSVLKAQIMTGIRAQRKGLRAQKNRIRDHKAFEPESGIRFITRSRNLLSQYFSA